MIKILSIGNSFSQDATAMLHDIAESAQTELYVVNLFIGGCSLKTHWENAQADQQAYSCEQNGKETGRFVSIKDALLEENWDFVTLQQASHDSGILETYHPYVELLSDYITAYAPLSKQLLHQTWAYEIDSGHECFYLYENSQELMFDKLKAAYSAAASQIHADIIPCGEVIQGLRGLVPFQYATGGVSLCRDGFHMGWVFGRYAVAAVWYETLTKKSILDSNFFPCEEQADRELILLIKDYVHRYLSDKKQSDTNSSVN